MPTTVNITATTDDDLASQSRKVKDAISDVFGGDANKFEKVFKIIDDRWNCQLRQSLHQAGYYLNTEIFYKNKGKIHTDAHLMERLYSVISRLVENKSERMTIDNELSIYIMLVGYSDRNLQFVIEIKNLQRSGGRCMEYWHPIYKNWQLRLRV